jgi:hypothetical protein
VACTSCGAAAMAELGIALASELLTSDMVRAGGLVITIGCADIAQHVPGVAGVLNVGAWKRL